MDSLKLTPRLRKAADFVREGSSVVDVGSDHGYLCAWLLRNGKIKYALSCDIGTGPLSNAKNTAIKYNLTSVMETRLSDGLNEVDENEVDDIVICGMGAELIVKILASCAWIKNSRLNFIFQPMTHSEILREYLIINNFQITNEVVVQDGRKHYVIINAHFLNEKKTYESYYKYVGEINDFCNENNRAYLDKQIKYLKNKSLCDTSAELLQNIKELEKLK